MWLCFQIVIAVCVSGMGIGTPTNQSHTCLYQDQTWQLGDIVTGDPCDKCMCTQFGVMCSYQVCGELFCVDAKQEEGECCKTCPNGNNCMYESGHGKFLVPELGCKIADEAICFCDRLETFCLPPLPMDMTPMCEKTN